MNFVRSAGRVSAVAVAAAIAIRVTMPAARAENFIGPPKVVGMKSATLSHEKRGESWAGIRLFPMHTLDLANHFFGKLNLGAAKVRSKLGHRRRAD